MRKLYLERNLIIVFGVTLMAIMSVSSIIPALPMMIDTFHLSPGSIGLVITGFTLPGMFSAPVVGILADRYGRKRVLVPCLYLFGVFGGACFLAESFTTLLLLRAVQGFAAGGIGMLNLTIIGDLYDGRDRIAAMGYNASVLSIGTGAFPAVGGLLALLGWNWPFLLPLLSLPLAVVVQRCLHTPEPKHTGSFADYLRGAWSRIKTRQAIGLFSVSLLTFIILYGGIVTYLPVLLDARFHASPVAIGLVVSISSLVTAVAASQLGRLARILASRTMIRIACVFYAASMLLVPEMPDVWMCILPVTLFGFAQGLNMPNVMTMVSEYASIEHRAAFMAVNGMVLRLGQTIAPVLMGLIYTGGGLSAVFIACASVGGLMLLVSLYTMD